MRKILFILFLFASISIYGQDKNDINEMLNNSLISILEKNEASINKGILKHSYFEGAYILMDNYPLNFTLFDSIKSLGLKTAFLKDIPQKELKKGISTLSFSYLSLDGNKITLFFAKIGVRKKKRYLERGLAEGYRFKYEYSCSENRWVLIWNNISD